MKKTITVLAVFGLIVLASCTQRTCPTYTKEVIKEKQERIKS